MLEQKYKNVITAYLDTSVYNKILNSDANEIERLIESCVREKKVIIRASLLNAQEILLADAESKRKLFSLARKITHNLVYEETRNILKLDFDSFLRIKTQHQNIYSTANWYSFLEKGTAGNFDQMYGDIKKDSSYHQYKPVFLSEIKEACEKADKFSDRNLRFSKVKLLSQKSDIQFLSGLLRLFYPAEYISDLVKLIDLRKMPRLRYVVKFLLHTMELHLTGGLKPKWGDNTDMQHVIYASDNKYFVTADKNFLSLLQGISNEDTKFLMYDDFAKEISSQSKWF